MSELLARPLERSLFVSGCASNQGRFYDRFDEVVLMSAPAEVILNRVAARSTNRYGKRSEERAEILANLEDPSKPDYQDPRHCLVFWARPPIAVRKLILEVQQKLLKVAPCR